jgi:hypothetical protein
MNTNASRSFMNTTRLLYHFMRADFLERTRSYRFVVTLLVIVFFTYFFVPALDAPLYGTLYMKYRGVYSSAWIGTLATLLMGEYLLIFGFYLVKGPIARDQSTGVGEIIAATPIHKSYYTLGKWLSHFAFFTAELGVILLTLLILQYLRAEDLRLDLWGLASPLLIFLLPALAVVAALAVLFESINWLRGVAGNLVYLFLVYPTIALPTGMSGAALLWSGVYRSCSTTFPDCPKQFLTDVSNVPLDSIPAFSYAGMNWTAGIVLGRLAFIAAAVGIALLAAVFFQRFDPAKIRSNWLDKILFQLKQAVTGFVTRPVSIVEPDAPILPIANESAHLMPLPKVAYRSWSQLNSYVQILAAEMRLAFRGVRWWWYLIAAALVGGTLFAPLEISHNVLLPAAWIWPISLWSVMGTREVRHHTEVIVLTGPYSLRRQFVATWNVGVIVAFIMGAGVIARLALGGEWTTLGAVGIGALFVPSLALALGSLSCNIPYLDFMGRFPEMIGIGIPWIYGGAAVLLFGLALLGRRRQISQ